MEGNITKPLDLSSTTSTTVGSTRNLGSVSLKQSSISSSTHIAPELSTLRLVLAHFGAALTLFLATTDATIVSTSLPTITSELTASQSQYTWVAVAYLLTQTAFQPLYGKLAGLFGQKNVLWCSIFVFALGSLLCGVARTIEWLIAARALAGIGGGGIVSCVWVLTAQLVPETSRAKWSQALSITWCCSAISGPLLGGVFSGEKGSVLSWRWAFYINLPICFCAAAIMGLSLYHVPLNATDVVTWGNFISTFDFIGLILFMTGTSCVVVGFSFATEVGWTQVSTLILISVGPVILLLGIFYESKTTRDALFPLNLIMQLPIAAILVLTFLHNLAFTAGTFYLTIYYQAVDGCTPMVAGIHLLPYSLGSSLASIPVAWFLEFWQKRKNGKNGHKAVICLGFLLSTVGFGLMIILGTNSKVSVKILFPLVAGIGVGVLFHAPYQVFTQALGPKNLSMGTSAFFLVRFTGSILGLAAAGAIFSGKSGDALKQLDAIRSASQTQQKLEMIETISSALQFVWIACSACCALAFWVSVFIPYSRFEHGRRDENNAPSETSETPLKLEA